MPTNGEDIPERRTKSSGSDLIPDLRGFVAGITSGLTKVTVGHPFDTVKLRVQCTPSGVYAGPIDCLLQTVRKEGFRGLYKGASPPAFGWALSDAILMGSYERYRTLLAELEDPDRSRPISIRSHAVAGVLAGWTVCSVITPIETLKAKLQMQTSDPRTRLYTGPIDCARQIVRQAGVRGLYHALPATLLFRSCFAVMFASYASLNSLFAQLARTYPDSPIALSQPAAQFVAGGIGAELFWLVGLPFDAVKNRMMCDSITQPKFPSWSSAARSIWADGGFWAFYRGFGPCMLRAFPTNAAALVVWEGVMRMMKTN